MALRLRMSDVAAAIFGASRDVTELIFRISFRPQSGLNRLARPMSTPVSTRTRIAVVRDSPSSHDPCDFDYPSLNCRDMNCCVRMLAPVSLVHPSSVGASGLALKQNLCGRLFLMVRLEVASSTSTNLPPCR